MLCRAPTGPVSVGELVGAQQGGLPGTDCSKGSCLVYFKDKLPLG